MSGAAQDRKKHGIASILAPELPLEVVQSLFRAIANSAPIEADRIRTFDLREFDAAIHDIVGFAWAAMPSRREGRARSIAARAAHARSLTADFSLEERLTYERLLRAELKKANVLPDVSLQLPPQGDGKTIELAQANAPDELAKSIAKGAGEGGTPPLDVEEVVALRLALLWTMVMTNSGADLRRATGAHWQAAARWSAGATLEIGGTLNGARRTRQRAFRLSAASRLATGAAGRARALMDAGVFHADSADAALAAAAPFESHAWLSAVPHCASRIWPHLWQARLAPPLS